MIWYKKNPALLEKVIEELERDFPSLRLLEVAEKIQVRGRFPVVMDGVHVDSYLIRMILSGKHPSVMPDVFEEGGRIPRIADRHINEDGSTCLFVYWEKAKYWSDPTSISQFLKGPVNDFFFGQSYFEKNGRWPFGDREHGLKGVLQSLEEESGLNGFFPVGRMLEMFATTGPRGHLPCPCLSKKKLRECHGPKLVRLYQLMGAREAMVLLGMFLKPLNELRKKQETAMRHLMRLHGYR